MSASQPRHLVALTLAALTIGLSLVGTMVVAIYVWPLALSTDPAPLRSAERRVGMGVTLIFTLALALPGLVAALALRGSLLAAFGLAFAVSAGCLFLGFAGWDGAIAGATPVRLLGATLCTLAAGGPALVATWALLTTQGRLDRRGRILVLAVFSAVVALAIAWLFRL